jgi:hypothetical protein
METASGGIVSPSNVSLTAMQRLDNMDKYKYGLLAEIIAPQLEF